MDEKTAAKKRTLFKGVVNGEGRLRNDMRIVNIGGDTNDALQLPGGLTAVGFQDRIGPEHVTIDWVLIGEHAPRKGFADDGDGLFASTVEFIEIATGNDGNAQRREEPGRDNTKLRAWVLFARGINVLNVHKIRVDSDNNRLARCTKMALTESRKVN